MNGFPELFVFGDPWELGAWVSTISGADGWPFRHMFLYFCRSNDYERMSSKSAEQEIHAAFSQLLASEEDSYKKNPSPTGLDASLLGRPAGIAGGVRY